MARVNITENMNKAVRNPGLWVVAVVLVLISIPHYNDSVSHPGFVTQFITALGISRATFERVLYLAPIIWSGFIVGWKGAFYTSVIAALIMLPKALFFSPNIAGAVFEVGIIFIVGDVLSLGFASLRREREYRKRLEAIQDDLKVSEERYRKLFENAQDGVWLHDLEGNFISFNNAAEKMIGYKTQEIFQMKAQDFLSQESLDLAQNVRRKLLRNEPVEQPYEQRVFRKDGREIYIQLSTSVVMDKGKPVGFQNIARDITEQKRMNENLHMYLQQATRAQEEERKRISHELHDETVQALVALSRQLDALAASKNVSTEVRQKLEELWNQTDIILQGVRRLSKDLRPAAIDRLGLLPAIESLAADIAGYSGIETKVTVIGEEHRLPEEGAIALFRIIQEALNNVWHHSEASKAEITIEFSEKSTKITVHDDGKGFEITDELGDLAKLGKLGLAGMQERVQLIGGTLAVDSAPGKGTVITVEAPG